MTMEAMTTEMHHFHRPSIYHPDFVSFDWNACQHDIWSFVKGWGTVLGPVLQNTIIKHMLCGSIVFHSLTCNFGFGTNLNICCTALAQWHSASPVYPQLQYTVIFHFSHILLCFPAISTEGFHKRNVSLTHYQKKKKPVRVWCVSVAPKSVLR